ncbi:MAG TPA: hypothetical protein VG755_39225 [Nannocystaceae bacterium]|nr:hypothetical protein [Nannocystaceae bacterium]
MALLLPLALGCAQSAESSPGGGTDEGDTSSSSESEGSSEADTTSTSDDGASSSTDDDSGSDTSTTGAQPSCDGITPTLLFTSAEHVGTISAPDSGAFLYSVFSYYAEATGEHIQSADDIDVPDGSCWCITRVDIVGGYMGEHPEIDEFFVNLYDDSDELPNEMWFSERSTPTTTVPLEGEGPLAGFSTYTVDLSEPPLVPAGRTWLEMVGLVPDGTIFQLGLSTDEIGNLSVAHLVPDECPDWARFEDCFTPGYPPPQAAFAVYGAELPCGS